MKKYGFDLCCQQLVDRIVDDVAYITNSSQTCSNYGDTPIERLFCTALWQSIRFLEQEWFTNVIPVPPSEVETNKQSAGWKRVIILERQAQLEGWRVDFLVHVYATWARDPDAGAPGWKNLIVECDGHDFHERTKEQAAKDRERDRRFQLAGIDVFRFTGSELWKDPLGCADQVIAWANRRV